MSSIMKGIVDEEVGGNYLYHATSDDGLKSILQSGQVNAANSPQDATKAQTRMPTVSMTRSWGYATGEHAKAQLARGSIYRDAVLIFDRAKIENNYKTLGTSQSRDFRGAAYLPNWNPSVSNPNRGNQNLDPQTSQLAKKRYALMTAPETDAETRKSATTPKHGGEFEEVVVVPKGGLPIKGTLVGFWVSPKSSLMQDPEIMNNPLRLEKTGPNKFVKATQAQPMNESENVSVIYINGKAATKYANKHEAEKDAGFLRSKYPDKKIEVSQEVRGGIGGNEKLGETEAKKGIDGKRCWKGKRYAGTENGKDKCIPVKEGDVVPFKKKTDKDKYNTAIAKQRGPLPISYIDPDSGISVKSRKPGDPIEIPDEYQDINLKSKVREVPKQNQTNFEVWGNDHGYYVFGNNTNAVLSAWPNGEMMVLSDPSDSKGRENCQRFAKQVMKPIELDSLRPKLKNKILQKMSMIDQPMNEAANPAQQAAIAVNMKKQGKKPKNVDEALGTPGGVEMFRTKDMVNTTMQQNLYRRELQAVKDAEKKKKQAAYRAANPREAVPMMHIGAGTYQIPAIQAWEDSGDVGEAIKYAVNKFANKQSKEFKADLASDPNFKKAVINFFNVGADNLAARNAAMAKRGGSVPDSDYRTKEQTKAGYNAVNIINDVLLNHMKKHGVDKTGRRVPPGFNYTLGEGVIVGHDASDPEIAVLGGAGTMSLSRLKKKAHGEALQLADDIANGKYNASSYNMKQLHNTLNTIVAAEEEMKKKYFGESAGENTYEIGQQLEDLAYEIKELADNAMRLVRGTPEEGRARSYWYPHIVMAISDDHGYMGKNMATMMGSANSLMHGEDDEMYEDYTGAFAAEKTPTINPYGGQKDRQFRGAIGEGIAEAREMSPALRAAQKNLVDLSTGEVRRREQAKKASAKAEKDWQKTQARWKRDDEREQKAKRKDADTIWRHVEHAISNYFPDGDPTDYLAPYMEKNGLTWDDITRAAKKNGYKDLWDYWNTLTQDIENDAYYDWHAAKRPEEPVNPLSKDAADIQHRNWVAKKNPQIRSRGMFLEEPTDPVGTQPGGWRRTGVKEELSRADVDSIARFADKLYKKIGIDVTFTKHFMDRVNDERNGKPISGAELVRLFKKEYERWGKDVAQLGPDEEGTFKDLLTDINLPFVLRWDRDEEELDLIAKTVMRKKNFKTPNKEFPVDEDTAFAGGMGQGGNAGQSYRKFTPKAAGTIKESSIMKGIKREGF